MKNLPDTTGHEDPAPGEEVYHIPVMLKETIAALNIRPGGTYVDCTYGGGGHSKAILEKLGSEGKLIVFDQDADARKNVPAGETRIIFIPQNFRHLQRFLRLQKCIPVDGILADLGVSSHQFDEAGRGFSTRFDASLDMRMDTKQALTAADVLQTFTESQLHKMFEKYGEVTNAKTLARTIVEQRSVAAFTTINRFKQSVQQVVKGNPNKYFAQVFQALRIEVNDEIGALKDMLSQTLGLLKPGGRIAVISFHSLEDRVVKTFFRQGDFSEEINDDVFGRKIESPLRIISKKPVTASNDEIKLNPRSRSAKLRVAEKKIMAEQQPVTTSSPLIKAEWKKFFTYKWVVKNIPFFLFLSALTVLYIYNGHHADKLIRKITVSEKNIKELEYEYKSVKSEVIFRSKASELVKAVEPLGLKETTRPPVMLIDSASSKEK